MIAKTKPSIKPNNNMKTRHQRKLSPRVAARRNPTIARRRGTASGKGPKAIRSYHFKVPNAALAELRARIKATKWPERETVTDQTQGVQLATIQALARYWGTKYDWRKVDARLNSLPQFITEIDGLDIHFIHVRSKHENCLLYTSPS